MKIVNLNEFRKQPIGTIFCKYEPCWFGNMNILTSVWDVDFTYQELNHPIPSDNSNDFLQQCEKMEQGIELSADYNNSERDGLYEKEMKYLIYSKQDVQDLITYLKNYEI